MNRFQAWLWTRKWILLAIAPFLLVWGVIFSRYHTFPSPVVGGDEWAQFGIVMHIWQGNPPWTDSMILGEYAFRDWLMYVIVAVISRVTLVSPLQTAILFPLTFLVVGAAAMYGIGRRTLKHEGLAVLLAIAWMGFGPTLEFKSSAFAAMATVPVALYFLVSQDGSLRRRLYLGLAYGAASLSYLVAFFGLTAILLVFFALDARRSFVKAFGSWFPTALVAMPIVVAMWGPLIVVYGGRVVNAANLYGDAGHGWGFTRATYVWRDLFFVYPNEFPPAFSALFTLAMSLLAAGGVYAAWRQRESHGGKYALVLLGVGLVGTFHYLVTEPLWGTNLVFFRFPKIFLHLAQILLALQAIVFLAARKTNRIGQAGVSAAGAFVIAGALILVPTYVSPDDAAAASEDELSRTILAMAAFVVQETPKDAVILGLDHESFVINGLTGRHVVVERRTHANVFVDMNQRYADAIVMMYGANRANATQLLDRYHVTHAYKGFYFERNWEVVPMFTTPDHAQYWRDNGIEFVEEMRPYDPAPGESEFFPVIRAIPPSTTDAPIYHELHVVYAGKVGNETRMAIYAR